VPALAGTTGHPLGLGGCGRVASVTLWLVGVGGYLGLALEVL
jgi:hypothetical protein